MTQKKAQVTKLTIELVPKSCWFSNVRSEVTKDEWDKIRKTVYKEADYKCEICGGKGNQHPVECHEIFSYDDENKIQKLERMVALCPNCHKVKHYGLWELKGMAHIVKKHLMKVNGWNKKDAEEYIAGCFELWSQRSAHQWKLDLSFLENEYDIKLDAEEYYYIVEEPDITKCPQCGGEADNGNDREVPPNPYLCTKCEEKLLQKGA